MGNSFHTLPVSILFGAQLEALGYITCYRSPQVLQEEFMEELMQGARRQLLGSPMSSQRQASWWSTHTQLWSVEVPSVPEACTNAHTRAHTHAHTHTHTRARSRARGTHLTLCQLSKVSGPMCTTRSLKRNASRSRATAGACLRVCVCMRVR